MAPLTDGTATPSTTGGGGSVTENSGSMAISPTAADTSTTTTGTAGGDGGATPVTVSAEEDLRRQLRTLAQNLKRREPLKPTYKHLLTDGIVTIRKPTLPKDKFYRRIGSRLRVTVEAFATEMQGKDPFDRIAQRQELETDKMRAALTLREFKEHEQTPLLEATLTAMLAAKRRVTGGGGAGQGPVDELSRRRYLDGVALGLQHQSTKKPRKLWTAFRSNSASSSSNKVAAVTEHDQKRQEARQREELKQQQLQAQEEQQQQNRRRRTPQPQHEGSKGGSSSGSQAPPPPETPQQALHKFYQPIFKLLWDMEFPYLGNTNPFRMVIDRENCAAVGAPDYFDIIEKPMNLTYIQQKVDNLSYTALSGFFQDVELMLQNALLYNSDPHNPYRIAAEEMQKKYKRAAKKVVQSIEKKYGNNNNNNTS